MPVHLEKQVQIRALLYGKALTKIVAKYSDYNNIFLAKNIMEFLKNFGMNEYAIKLEKSK